MEINHSQQKTVELRAPTGSIESSLPIPGYNCTMKIKYVKLNVITYSL